MKKIVALLCIPTIALASGSPTIYDSPLYSPTTPPSPQGAVYERWDEENQVWTSSNPSSPTPSIASQSSMPGSPKSPLEWAKDVRPRAALVTELSNKLTELEQLKQEFEQSLSAFDGLKASPVAAGPLKDKMDSFIEAALQDKTALGQKCTSLACQIASIKGQLERADSDLKQKASTHLQQKISGITEDLINKKQAEYERNEQHLAAAHVHINTVLPASFNYGNNPFDPTQATRGGSEIDAQQQKLEKLITSISDFEEEAWMLSKELSQQKDTPVSELQKLAAIQQRLNALKKEAGHLALAAYPDKKEREAALHIQQAQTVVITTHPHPAVTQNNNPSAPRDTTLRSVIKKAAVIHVIITVG